MGFWIAPSIEVAASEAWVDYANTFKTKPYAVVNLNLGYEFENGPMVFVDVRNILDENYVSNFTPMGLLERCHSYKDKVTKGIAANHGLFAYPVLMAADILLFQSNLVPVGKDQKQHVEVARDIAIKFNNEYGEIFTIPEPEIDEEVATVPGLDGQKMSKSYGNTIDLFAEDNALRKQVMRIVTDPTPVEEPKDPDKCNVYKIYRLFLDKAQDEACSTVAGINCALWHHLGLESRFWDISLHTVSEVFYDGGWHMYDNSMSALYTLCDGRTLAGVEEIGKEGSCPLSDGKVELGHIAKYHCLYSTGPNGFLTGADTQRSLDEESRCFNPKALKYRYYYCNWDYGHRYVLNLRPNEVYTRHYTSQSATAEFYVPNHGKDPENCYRIRGNGFWRYKPVVRRRE